MDIGRASHIYLADERAQTFVVWICVFEDRADGRYWKETTLRGPEAIDAIAGDLEEVLEAGRTQAEAWHATDLAFVTEIK